ncbi:MAG: hypothetical protein LBR95_03890, partial [Azoarcus sp.]|nr:hypothetical protein [Azoarcus sp.]
MNTQTQIAGESDNLESIDPALSRVWWIEDKKKSLVLLADVVALLLLWKFLPYEPKTNAGLALFFFVGVLWLTEAIHITFTALAVPVL